MPEYSLQYTRRSTAAIAVSLVAMNVPEPGGALLIAVGGVVAVATSRRTMLQSNRRHG